MPDYPIIKIPQRILQINKSVPATPSVPEIPVEPIEPIQPELPKLLPTKNNFASSGCLSSIIAWAIGITIFAIGNMGGGHPIATGIAVPFLLFAMFRSFSLTSKSAEKSNKAKQELYQREFAKYKESKKTFKSKKAECIVKKINYDETKREYDLLLEKRNNNSDYEWEVWKFRDELLAKALSESTIPIAFQERQYKQGVAEALFFDKLVKFFSDRNYCVPSNLFKGKPVVPKGNFGVDVLRQHIASNNDMERPFMPDFILSITSTKQNLVIEIDEPYVGSDGTPIHYIDSKDAYRDSYFLANGWIIIRFAEEQIIKYPSECCWFIADTLLQNTPSFEVGSIQNEMMSY